MNKNISLLIISLSILLMSACGTKQQGVINKTNEKAYELSDRLKRIKLSTLDGQPFDLTAYSGKPVFLNFWATWCAPCISEMPSIETLHERYGDQVVFLAASTESLSKISSFQEERKFPFVFARLEVEYIDAFIIKLPTTLLINSKGELIHELEGGQNWTSSENIEKLKEVL
jgi:thiol-disulfide isomerase/thioredoxin